MTVGRKIVLLGIGCCFALGITQNAFAVGSVAFRNEASDAGALGKGSAFVGEANRPSAVYYNPAGLTQLKNIEISAGITSISPFVYYENTSGQETKMRKQNFFIPNVYAAIPIPHSKFVLGFGATSYFGLGTYWSEDSFSKYVSTKSDMVNKDFMLTASYKVSDKWSVALGVDADVSKADSNKKLLQIGQTDGNFQMKGHSTGWGYRIAALHKINDRHQIGIMYRSTIVHKYRGKIYLENLQHGSGLTDYLSIFGNSSYETDASEKLTMPQSVVCGYSFKPNSKWTFNLDLEWMDWSSVQREYVKMETESNPTRLAVLNSGNPAARDWKAVWSEAIGAEYAMTDRFRLRGGYFHHQFTVPNANFTSQLPDSSKNGVTFGFGYDLTKAWTVDFAYTGIFYRSRNINNVVGATSGASINGKYKQYGSVFLLTVGYKFK